jgi:signal transduction histidine kinase
MAPQADAQGNKFLAKYSDIFPKMIESDRHRYQQVLLNLIVNANKFTKHG